MARASSAARASWPGASSNKQVRLGRPIALRGLPDSASGPAFATAAGLLAWAAGEGRTMHDVDLEVERPTGFVRRIVNFLKERV